MNDDARKQNGGAPPLPILVGGEKPDRLAVSLKAVLVLFHIMVGLTFAFVFAAALIALFLVVRGNGTFRNPQGTFQSALTLLPCIVFTWLSGHFAIKKFIKRVEARQEVESAKNLAP